MIGIPCPICTHQVSKVIETRGNRRRRECLRCRHKWTTLEVPHGEYIRAIRLRERVRELVRALQAEEEECKTSMTAPR